MSLSTLQMQISSKIWLYNDSHHLTLSTLIHFFDSIVAVHGLNPANKESHAKQTWTSDESKKLWLSDSDFLPKRFSQARVLLFGYNSNVAFKTSTAGVREQAGNLLNRLKIERPVVFPGPPHAIDGNHK